MLIPAVNAGPCVTDGCAGQRVGATLEGAGRLLHGLSMLTCVGKAAAHASVLRSMFPAGGPRALLAATPQPTTPAPLALGIVSSVIGVLDMVLGGIDFAARLRRLRELRRRMATHRIPADSLRPCPQRPTPRSPPRDRSMATGRARDGLGGDGPGADPASRESPLAHADRLSAMAIVQRQIHDAFLGFFRDVVAQGGSVACALALQWHSLRRAGGAPLARALRGPAGTIVGAVFQAAVCLLHVATGLRARRQAVDTVRAATAARRTIKDRLRALPLHSARYSARYSEALQVTRALLTHASQNEKLARQQARDAIRMESWRIRHGLADLVIGAISTALCLLTGGVSGAGLLVGIAAAALSALWLIYLLVQKRRGVKACQATQAMPDVDDRSARPGVPAGGAMALDAVIRRAVALLSRPRDRDGKAGRLLRRVLVAIGLPDAVLGMAAGQARPQSAVAVRDAVEFSLRRLISSDGARQIHLCRLHPLRAAASAP